MIIIEGQYGSVNCFADDIENRAVEDIKRILSCPLISKRKIAIMPDAHANGNGTITGFTMTDGEEVILGLERDSGCGVSYSLVNVTEKDIDFSSLDEACHDIPAGKGSFYLEPAYPYDFTPLHCYEEIKHHLRWPVCLGSLGGGNHFIELDKDEEGNIYLVVHNGLGGLSGEAVDFYMAKALQNAGKTKENATLEDAILVGKDKADFQDDMRFFERLCEYNRAYISDYIIQKMGWKTLHREDICHHFQSQKDGIIRHGAISAQAGEPVLIPVNAKEGALLGKGRGNPDWNYSAPHGGGRLYSRRGAMSAFTLQQYQEQMKGVKSSTIFSENLDEIPSAYRSLESIKKAIEESVEVEHVLTPLFNYKGK